MMGAEVGIGPEILLSICIVTYKPDRDVLEGTVASLERALKDLDPRKVRIFIVDNSPSGTEMLNSWLPGLLADHTVAIIGGHGNVGFGRANNMMLDRTGVFHLVLNPDVYMQVDALVTAIDFMAGHPDCVLLTPAASSPDGWPQYLCKRYPAILDLLLRGFAPATIRRLFQTRLDRYEMRDYTLSQIVWDPPIVSGCYMFFRGDIFRALNGFNPQYMLYFEDFDLSLRASQLGRLAYVPAVRIVHCGGHAARKGWFHIRHFVRSAVTFYSIFGIKIF